MKSELHRLLTRQLKKHLSADEIEALPSALLEDISKSYEEFYKEKEFLEHTIDLNSQELGAANEKIVKQNSSLQKLLEERVDENQETINILKQYKAAIDASLIVSTTTPDSTIKYVNDNFLKISKYSQEELVGKQHNIVRHPDNPPSLFRDMWKTILDKRVFKGSFANRAKDGSTYFVNAVIVPLLNLDGEIIEFMALRQDITQEVMHQQKIEVEKQRVTQILDNQESMIILFDAQFWADERSCTRIKKEPRDVAPIVAVTSLCQE
jgi:PAS domain S-box-containing protein